MDSAGVVGIQCDCWKNTIKRVGEYGCGSYTEEYDWEC